jgi:hypothetical protein
MTTAPEACHGHARPAKQDSLATRPPDLLLTTSTFGDVLAMVGIACTPAYETSDVDGEHGRGVRAGSWLVVVVPRCARSVWDRVSVVALGEFAAWARRPAENVLVLSELAARRSASTVNRMLAAVVSFSEFGGRRGNELARDLVVRTRSGRGAFKPFLHGAGGSAGAAA